LENLKNEFDSITHDLNMYKMQKDDYERKLQAQLGELNTIQQTLYDLERNHAKIKQQYEDEILRLRRQLDMNPQAAGAGGSGGASGTPNTAGRDLSSPLQFRSSSPAPGQSPLAARPPNPTSTISTTEKGGLAPFDPKRTNFSGATGKRGRSGSNEYYPPQPGFPNILSPIANPNDSATPKHPKNERKDISEQPLPLPNIRDHKEPTPSGPRGMEPMHTPNEISISPKEGDPEKPRGRTLPEDPDDGKDKIPGAGSDWIVGYNPGVQTNLNIDLMHNLNHSSVVCCVKFSADGKYLSTGCNRSAQIYDVESGKKVHTFSDDNAKEGDLYIRSVSFSPDGQYLATGAEDKTVRVWDIQHKRILHTFVGHELDIYSLDFSHDGRFIVSGSGDKKAKIWDIDKGKCAYTLGNEEVGPKDGVTSVAISPDGRLVAAGSLDRIVRLWDAQTGYFLERYEGHLDSVYSVAFSPDGKSLASGSLDKTLKLWDLSGSRARSRCRSTFTGHKDFVLSVAFSPDGNWLISGSKDRSVQFWDPRSAVTHMMLQGHKNSVISVALSPAGGVFATGSGDYRARLWKYES
jgi:glucose repression regulatory protein TUP1